MRGARAPQRKNVAVERGTRTGGPPGQPRAGTFVFRKALFITSSDGDRLSHDSRD